MTERDQTASRADLHCHSPASAVAKLGVPNALGLPECATPDDHAWLQAHRAIYIETHGGTGIGGTGDHAGIDIGRTYSAPRARAGVGPARRRPSRRGHLRRLVSTRTGYGRER